MKKSRLVKLSLYIILFLSCIGAQARSVRVMVITGGHSYAIDEFNQMFSDLGDPISFEVVSFPEAYSLFLPENRSQYDVLVFYHMWQDITVEEGKNISECIKEGKPLVVLHHSICAFDNWPEYINVIGGKYFHKPTLVDGMEYPVCKYKYGLSFIEKVVDPKHPVTKGISDFEVLEEAYLGFYVHPEATPLLTTDEPNSSPVVAWAKKYGKAQVVTIQSGHGVATYQNPSYQKLLKQSILWAVKKSK
jgi:type 1 glutamine amidotransferase